MSKTIRISGCVQCKCDWEIPEALYLAAKASEKITFYCPYGHSQVFSARPSEADLLRQERDRLKQDAARLQESIDYQRRQREHAERRASAARGQVTKLKKRAAAGVCPCCNRSFVDLHRHMSAKHKGFIAEEVEGFEGETIQ